MEILFDKFNTKLHILLLLTTKFKCTNTNTINHLNLQHYNKNQLI